MSLDLIQKVNNEIKEYYLYVNVESLISKASSISEILHIFHSYVINNVNILQSCNLLNQIKLYGVKTHAS